MNRRLMLLNGLAIVAVVANHTAEWGFVRLNGGNVPDASQGTIVMAMYVFLLMLTKLASFCVPAFLFAAGAFMVYSDRKSALAPSAWAAFKTANWQALRTRLLALILPYVIWSILIFVWLAAQGTTFSAAHYVSWMLTGGAIGPYYFVPMLCQFIVLSPVILWLAKHHFRLLLIVSAIMQFGIMALQYVDTARHLPIIGHTLEVNRHWSFFPSWAFFYVLGVAYAMYSAQVKPWVVQHRQLLLTGTIIFGVLALVEAQWLIVNVHVNWRFSPLTLSSSIYALGFILTFLAYENVAVPFTPALTYLSTRTFGIYLAHEFVLKLFGEAIIGSVGWLSNQVLIYTLILAVAGIAIPLALMLAVVKSPARKYYKYIFG